MVIVLRHGAGSYWPSSLPSSYWWQRLEVLQENSAQQRCRRHRKYTPVKVRDVNGAGNGRRAWFPLRCRRGFFLIPIIEEMEEMSLTVIPVEVFKSRTKPDKNGCTGQRQRHLQYQGDVDRTTCCRLRSSVSSVRRLNKSKALCFMTLEGNLRGVVGSSWRSRSYFREREKFQATQTRRVLDLNTMGIGADTFKIGPSPTNAITSVSPGKKQHCRAGASVQLLAKPKQT